MKHLLLIRKQINHLLEKILLALWKRSGHIPAAIIPAKYSVINHPWENWLCYRRELVLRFINVYQFEFFKNKPQISHNLIQL